MANIILFTGAADLDITMEGGEESHQAVSIHLEMAMSHCYWLSIPRDLDARGAQFIAVTYDEKRVWGKVTYLRPGHIVFTTWDNVLLQPLSEELHARRSD